MNNSDDDEDFLSADEDGFDEDKDESSLAKIEVSKDISKETTNLPDQSEEPVIETGKAEEKPITEKVQEEIEETKKPSGVELIDNDQDEEELLAERIRERNLKLARKFSAEIAKNVRASAPIPVKCNSPFISSKTSTLQNQDTPDIDKKILDPPAPPPTPALSSSFNSNEPCSSSTTQYGWRIPAKREPTLTQQESSCLDVKSEQARQALDRMSERLSQTDKNLFERVAEDIKKVSLRTEASESQKSETTTGHIPSISDLGSSLSGWSWNSASKLLASASQVTSQVSSVIDSVVNVTHLSDQESKKSTKDESELKETSEDKSLNTTPTTESNLNEAIVGFTLNAMESLGKKAFGVMTERDDSGSLQIKGLGRPWEHLLNTKQTEQSEPYQDHSEDFKTEEVDLVPKSRDSYLKNEEQHTSLKNRKRRSNLQDND